MADDEANTEAKEGKLKAILAWLKAILVRLTGWVFKPYILLWGFFKARWVKFKAWVFKPRIFLGGFLWCLVVPTFFVGVALLFNQYGWANNSWIETIGDWLGGTTISPLVSLYAFFVATFGLFLAGRRTQEFLNQNKIAERGQVIERFTRAIEQLGNDNQAVRVGGLYGLERIAGTSSAERRQAISMLAGFVRSKAPIEYQKDEHGNIKKVNNKPVTELSKPRSEKIDIETAVKILADIVKPEERLDKNGERSIDLSATDLRDLRLQEQKLQNFNFQGAFLSNEENPMNLINVNLTSANLESANLTSANLLFANLTSAYLFGAKLTSAYLFGAKLTSAHLVMANLTSATLRNTNFTRVNLASANLTSADLMNANLTSADLESAEGLTQEQIKDIRYKEGKPPKLPIGLVLPKADHNIIKPGDYDLEW